MLEKQDKGIYRYSENTVELLKIKSDDGCTGCYFLAVYGRNAGNCQMEGPSLFFKKCKGYIYVTPITFAARNLKEKDLVD